VRAVTPDYFTALALPVRQGRAFQEGDRAGTEPAAIVNEAYVRRYFANGTAVDQSLWIGHTAGAPWEEPTVRRIVGVVADVREDGPAQAPPPTVFLPLAQLDDAAFWEINRLISPVLIARQRSRADTLVWRLESLVQAVDGHQAVARPRALATVHADYLALPRFLSLLLGGFGALSLLLAAIGLYALISYTVQVRLHEIGVRMALGATAGRILSQVIAQSLRLSIVAISVGLLLAWPARHWLASRMLDIPPLAPKLIGTTAMVLLTSALLASLLPARRAASTDPMKVLREE
jgi:putative ABC transport system permease protein